MNRLRIAVIGAGHLGKIHTRLLCSQEHVQLVAVADPSPSAQQQILDEFDTRTVSDFSKLVGEIDAAVIATPTRTHFDIASYLLNHGIHCLIEKPLTDSAADAQALVEVAQRSGCVVQVGQVERFNPAIAQAMKNIGEAKFVSAKRLSGYTFRSTDIGVVHDLMIHDIDLINSFFPGELVQTNAVGMSMFGHHEDMAEARLEFSCGGVANLTASRCSFENQRSMQIFGTKGFAHVNLATSKLTVVTVPAWMREQRFDLLDTTPEQQAFIRKNLFESILPKQEIEVEKSNAILDEQRDWIDAIQGGHAVRVSVEEGRQAVAICESVLSSLAAHSWSPEKSLAPSPFGIITKTGTRREVTPVRKAA